MFTWFQPNLMWGKTATRDWLVACKFQITPFKRCTNARFLIRIISMMEMKNSMIHTHLKFEVNPD